MNKNLLHLSLLLLPNNSSLRPNHKNYANYNEIATALNGWTMHKPTLNVIAARRRLTRRQPLKPIVNQPYTLMPIGSRDVTTSVKVASRNANPNANLLLRASPKLLSAPSPLVCFNREVTIARRPTNMKPWMVTAPAAPVWLSSIGEHKKMTLVLTSSSRKSLTSRIFKGPRVSVPVTLAAS